MSRFQLLRSSFARALVLLGAVLILPAARAQTDTTRIVSLAGPKDHGFSGRHEYEADRTPTLK
jgi:hypothetical protein